MKDEQPTPGLAVPCQEIVELVTDYLEGKLDPQMTAEVEAHLELCDGCHIVTIGVRSCRGRGSSPARIPAPPLEPRRRSRRKLVPPATIIGDHARTISARVGIAGAQPLDQHHVRGALGLLVGTVRKTAEDIGFLAWHLATSVAGAIGQPSGGNATEASAPIAIRALPEPERGSRS